MRIALLADIHGNLHALQAVMGQIRTGKVDRMAVLGDLSFGLPFVNETVSLIRSVPHTMAVRGNGEDRLLRLASQDRAGWVDGQMRAAYWTVRNLSLETYGYLASLPETTCVKEGFMPVYAAHTLFRMTGIEEPLDGEVTPALTDDLREGVLVFGHTHRSWQARRGKTILVNPGSVGLPMDGMPEASYAILDERDGTWQVEQYRVSYDVESLIAAVRTSSLYEADPVWAALAIRELRTARNHVYPFLVWCGKYARQIGDSRRPFAPDTWEAAYRAWNFNVSFPAVR